MKLNIKDGKYKVLKDNKTLLTTTMRNDSTQIIFAESDYKYNKNENKDKITFAIYSMDANDFRITKLFDADWECSYIQVSPNNNEIMYMNSLNKLVISNFVRGRFTFS